MTAFGTFHDAQSIDHAAYGADILFKEGKIGDYIGDNIGDMGNSSTILRLSGYTSSNTREICPATLSTAVLFRFRKVACSSFRLSITAPDTGKIGDYIGDNIGDMGNRRETEIYPYASITAVLFRFRKVACSSFRLSITAPDTSEFLSSSVVRRSGISESIWGVFLK